MPVAFFQNSLAIQISMLTAGATRIIVPVFMLQNLNWWLMIKFDNSGYRLSGFVVSQ